MYFCKVHCFEEVVNVKQELRNIRDWAELDFQNYYKASTEMAQLAGKECNPLRAGKFTEAIIQQ